MKVYLRLYNLHNSLSPFSQWYWSLFTKWNHCSLQFDNNVMHCFDDFEIPRWVSLKGEGMLFKGLDAATTLYIGETDEKLCNIVMYVNTLPPMTPFKKFLRWPSSVTRFIFPPKRDDCVHKCSLVLNRLFDMPIITTNAEDMLRKYNLKIEDAIK